MQDRHLPSTKSDLVLGLRIHRGGRIEALEITLTMAEASNSLESGKIQGRQAKLEELRQNEESHRRAVADAMKPIAEGGAQEAVIEDLRDGYYIAKQARENFEKQGSR